MRKRIIRQFLQDVLATAITAPIGSWAVHYAYETRGYAAIGGENLFIPIVFLGFHVGCGWVIDTLEEMRWNKNLNQQPIPAKHEEEGAADRC